MFKQIPVFTAIPADNPDYIGFWTKLSRNGEADRRLLLNGFEWGCPGLVAELWACGQPSLPGVDLSRILVPASQGDDGAFTPELPEER